MNSRCENQALLDRVMPLSSNQAARQEKSEKRLSKIREQCCSPVSALIQLDPPLVDVDAEFLGTYKFSDGVLVDLYGEYDVYGGYYVWDIAPAGTNWSYFEVAGAEVISRLNSWANNHLPECGPTEESRAAYERMCDATRFESEQRGE